MGGTLTEAQRTWINELCGTKLVPAQAPGAGLNDAGGGSSGLPDLPSFPPPEAGPGKGKDDGVDVPAGDTPRYADSHVTGAVSQSPATKDDGKALPATDTELFFDRDSAVLTGPDENSLFRFSQTYLRSGSTEKITLDGYASRDGDPGYNKDLASKRAYAVFDALVRSKVPADRIVVKGHDPTDEFSKDDPKQNRRVSVGPKPATPPPAEDAGGKPVGNGGEKPASKPDLGTNRPPKPTITLSGDPPPTPDPPFHPKPDDDSTMLKDMDKKMARAAELAKQVPKGRSVGDAFADAVVDALNPVIDKLPVSDALKTKARNAIRDGVKSGSESVCDAGIDAAASGATAEALKAACKAALEHKPSEPGGGDQK